MRKVYPTILRCYARPEGDHYLAFCVELGLCDRGETLETAKASLEEDLLGYLESLTPENVGDLFPRPAPWYVYLDYYRVYLLVALHRFWKYLGTNVVIFQERIVPHRLALQPLG